MTNNQYNASIVNDGWLVARRHFSLSFLIFERISMNRTGTILGLFCALILSVSAQAQERFSTSSSFTVNPDFNSGTASGSSYGMNAVVTDISSSAFFEIDQFTGQAYIYAYMSLSGVWGDPSSTSPYYNFLQNPGLSTNSSIALTTVSWNGNWYEFENMVSLSMYGSAGLYRNPEHTELYGHAYGITNAVGAVPISSTSSYHIYAAGHPSWLPDWKISIGSTWLVTTDMNPAFPAPGSMALIGIGGLVALRRRRLA